MVVTWPTGGVSNAVTYHFNAPPPELNGITPSTGLATGGSTTRLSGENLQYVTSVTFGGMTASFTITGPTAITVVVPPGPAGTSVTVTVTSSGGTSTSVTFFYTYPKPSITSITPSTGPSNGGTTIIIRGTHLQYVMSVTFEGSSATFTIFGPTSLIVTVPPGSPTTTVNVNVTSPGGTSGTLTFHYTFPHSVVDIPHTDIGVEDGGNDVTISGSNLGYVTVVYFGTTIATIVTQTTASITVIAPADAGFDGDSVGDIAGRSHVRAAVHVPGARAGDHIHLADIRAIHRWNIGHPLRRLPHNSDIRDIRRAGRRITNDQATSVTVTVPAGTPTTTVTVSVTTPQGQSNSVTYHYTYPTPTVFEVTPTSGPATSRNTVLIFGENLKYVTGVYFGTTRVTVTTATTTVVAVVAPAGSPGNAVTVSVTSPAGRTFGGLTYTYQVPAPILTSISPTSDPSTGGTSVTLYGSYLGTVTSVNFGGTPNISVNGTTSILVTVPPGTPTTTVQVTVVISPRGPSNSVTFTYTLPHTHTVHNHTRDRGRPRQQHCLHQRHPPAVRDGRLFGTTLVTATYATTTFVVVVAPPGTPGDTVTVSVTSPAGRKFGLSYTYSTVTANPPSITTTSLPSGTIGDFYTTTVSATGGTGTYTWTMLTLPTGLTYTSFTGEITGTPTEFGTFIVHVTVRDGNGTSDSTTLTLTVTANPPSITTTSLPSGTIGDFYTTTVSATGGTGTYTWTMLTLPTGLTYTSFTGEITGTPTEFGTFIVHVTVPRRERDIRFDHTHADSHSQPADHHHHKPAQRHDRRVLHNDRLGHRRDRDIHLDNVDTADQGSPTHRSRVRSQEHPDRVRHLHSARHSPRRERDIRFDHTHADSHSQPADHHHHKPAQRHDWQLLHNRRHSHRRHRHIHLDNVHTADQGSPIHRSRVRSRGRRPRRVHSSCLSQSATGTGQQLPPHLPSPSTPTRRRSPPQACPAGQSATSTRPASQPPAGQAHTPGRCSHCRQGSHTQRLGGVQHNQAGTFLVFITVHDGNGTTDSVSLNLTIFGT